MPSADKTFLLEGQEIRAPRPDPGLYVTSTPIGNMSDITLRALQILAGADVIYCEDTRVSSKLARNYGISTPLRAYHEHNAAKQRPVILKQLRDGAAIALISDAGTPLISDPGFKLVREAASEGLQVTVIPGATAMIAGLTLSGLPSDRVLFAGFPPPKQGARRSYFEELAGIRATLVFYVSPRRLAAELVEMKEVFGPRQAAVAREITKLHEEVLRGSLSEIASEVNERSNVKGEVTVIIAPPQAEQVSDEQLRAQLRDTLQRMSLRDAVDAVSAASGSPRRSVYRLALELERASSGDGTAK